jgi:hypothetical protein
LFQFLYSDGAKFAVDREGKKIAAYWPDTLIVEDVCVYILGPVLGLVLHLHGRIPLHASVVAIDNGAVAFMGNVGAGKSTTAAALTQFGSRFVSDDLAVLVHEDAEFTVAPGYPRANLWIESARFLFPPGRKIPLISANWDKHFMSFSGCQFESEPMPLTGIYELRSREPQLTEPLIEPLRGHAAMLALLSNTYMARAVGPGILARELNEMSLLAERVAIRTLRAPAALDRLPLLCGAIQNNLREARKKSKQQNPAVRSI